MFGQKQLASLKGLAVVAGAAAVLFASPVLAQSKTAQSVQVNTNGLVAEYEIADQETWAYDFSNANDAAAAYDTYFTISVSGGTPTTQQVRNAKHDAFKDPNKCHLWRGEALETVTSKFGPKGVITSTPKSLNAVVARTGWTRTSLVAGAPIPITVSDIYVAAQSVVSKTKTKNSPWTTKYSFGLTDSVGASSLTELVIELVYDDGSGSAPVVVDTRSLGIDFDQTVETVSTWDYAQSGGGFGHVDAQALLLNGDVLSIQNGVAPSTDDFSGNNNTGGQRALIQAQSYSIEAAGSYTLRVRGTVKGNAFIADQSFTMERTLAIIGGCD